MRFYENRDPFKDKQPTMTFAEDLSLPLHTVRPPRFGKLPPQEGELSLDRINLRIEFNDPLLETAYEDFRRFLTSCGIEISEDGIDFTLKRGATECFEAYVITVSKNGVVISANDTEGMRRAVYFTEDEMMRREGARLPIGEIRRRPFIKKRISRCYFSPASHAANFTNEGGYDYRYRFLKNIMGLWMIQSVRHEYDDKYSFGELCRMAEEAKNFPSRVNVDDESFFAPESMIQAIKAYCKASEQPIPETPGEIATVVYQSLADCYGATVHEIEAITGKFYDAINIVGGGANADYLSQLTANSTQKTVYAGPTEATAIGNLVAQMINGKEYDSLEAARKNIFDSFAVKTFLPQ